MALLRCEDILLPWFVHFRPLMVESLLINKAILADQLYLKGNISILNGRACFQDDAVHDGPLNQFRSMEMM